MCQFVFSANPWSDLPRPPYLARDLISRPVIRVPTSPSYSAIGIRLLLQGPDSATSTLVDDAFGIGVLERPNGGTVYVVAQTTSLKGELFQSLTALRTGAREEATPVHANGRFVGILARDDQRILADLSLA
jgi:hypothetical protein